jgi:serine/threonine-protein kinase
VSLVGELGRGATAIVYRGILEGDLRRSVAVKVFDLSSSDEPEGAIVSMARAAQRAACVVHPNVAQVIDFAPFDDNRQAAMVLELVDGMTLARLIEAHARGGRRLPLDLALFVATEIAEALSGARAATTPEGLLAGMAHLDLSAHQVILSRHGEVKLTDFGLAGANRWGSSVRSLRAVTARAASMSPEIARGRPGDTRSDVFSLGIALREMLVGPRFSPDLDEALALEHARDGHVPATFLELQLPADVREILGQALQVDPARRFPHATAMAYELRRVALSMGVGDGRVFLRAAVASLGHADAAPLSPRATTAVTFSEEDEKTEELEVADLVPASIPPDRVSGLIRKADGGDVMTNGTDDEE